MILFVVVSYQIKIGTKAPDFTLPDQNGAVHTLSDHRGEKVILCFYPKDRLKAFTVSNYRFDEVRSTDTQYVFLRTPA